MYIVALVLSYLIGSVPAGAWVARAHGVDIQRVGSGNPGATNILRTLGWGPALLVAAFDILKGAAAALLARALIGDPMIAALCGLLAVLGHNYSVFMGFRGGKGVATTFGTLIVIQPAVGLVMFVVGVFCLAVTRFVSAGSMVGAVAALTVAVALARPLWEIGVVAVLVVLLVWQHKDNIQRLKLGVERRFGEKVAK